MFNSYIIKIFLISIVLYLLLFYFIYEIYRQKKINLDSRYLKKIKKRLNKLDRKYIKSTGINKKIKILNVYNILLVEFVLFIIFFKFNLKSTGNIVVALTFSVLISLMPIIVLDIYKKYLDMKIRKQLVNFISTMNRWCQVKEDIFFCFEKTYLTKIGNPLNRYIFEFLTQVNMGMDIADALKILEMKFDNRFLIL
ncbi:MAG: hypothetical protein B6I28_00640 [Fusobacteriia bacterium 4572_132]|nr:MAG: hypothetical protein B6I28_00640 [Fusobacteriia bacterium 4572_132]